MKKILTPKVLTIIGILAIIGIISYGVYSYRHTISGLKTEIAANQSALDAAKVESAKRDQDIQDVLSKLQNSSSYLSDQIANQAQKSNAVEQQVGQVSSTVGTLQKLSQTDPELLRQYSKVYFLNEHYVPVSLTNINPKYIFTPGKVLQIHSNVAPNLNNLMNDAIASNMGLRLDSAYRSFGTQAVLKSSYRVTYGAGTANSFSAEQGYSEHQLGTAVDFTANSLNGGLSGFDKTIEYQWLQNNAYRYGFVISYPQGNTSYQFEPWHWRFVGKSLAIYLHEHNQYFYNMDQRQIDTYLANIFD